MIGEPSSKAPRLWYLEGFADDNDRVRRVPVLTLPFRVGRRPGLELTIPSDHVSQQHAELYSRDGVLLIRDLKSTNGTFLNGKELAEPAEIHEGDVIHFAQLEFRLGILEPGQTQAILGSTMAVNAELPELLVERTRLLREMVKAEAAFNVYQPIVHLTDTAVIGFEALGRTDFDGLPSGSNHLFEIAAVAGMEVELSRLFRRRTAEEARRLPAGSKLFLNIHPLELRNAGLIDTLRDLRRGLPDVEMVLEIHEAAITSPPQLRELRAHLRELGIELAFDDFGAGQARLVELAEDPPDYLKFDISMIRGIEHSSASKQTVTESLVRMALDLEVSTIAEGVESHAEALVCGEIGFTYGQGYLYGLPLRSHEIGAT